MSLDIICFDSELSGEELLSLGKPSREAYDPLGHLYDVSVWVTGNSFEEKNTFGIEDVQDLQISFKKVNFDFEEIKSSLDNEDVIIIPSKKEKEMLSDMVFFNGKFVRIFVMPVGRHYFKVFKDDIEYMGKD